METTMNTSNDTTKLSAIERALAAAKARKAAKGMDASEQVAAPVKAKAKTPKAPKAETEETDVAAQRDAKRVERLNAKAAKLAQLTADREARKTAREAAKAEKAAARAAATADKVPAHMKKVAKAAEKLPQLRTDVQLAFSDIVSNFSRDQIAALALHLQHHNRVAATQRAATMKLENGDTVRIVGGDPKYIGMSGTVDRAQRIRCYVMVPGVRKPVYLFTSDVEKVQALAEAASA